MTDVKETILRHLRIHYKTYQAIITSIDLFRRNLLWQKVNKSPGQIALINYDIINDGILTLSSYDLSLRIDTIKDEDYGKMNGCYSIRDLFNRMNNYCLPLGSKNELLDKKVEIGLKLGIRAKKFRNTLQESINQPNAIAYISERYSTQEIDEIIAKEIEELSLNLDDYVFLDNVLNNAISVDEIVHIDSNFDNSETFKKAMKFLNGKGVNNNSNINTALNMAIIPLIIEGNKKESQMPVLITQTDWILEAKNRFPAVEGFEIINNYFYLYFSQLLSIDTDNDIEAGIFSSESLIDDLKRLINVYVPLITEINHNRIDPLDFNSVYYNSIKDEYNKFLRTWDWLFEPFIINSLNDSIAYQNSLRTPLIKNLLLNSNIKNDSANSLIKNAINVLEKKILANTELSQILSRSSETVSVEYDKKMQIEGLVDLTYVFPEKDNGKPFSKVEKATSLNDLNNEDVDRLGVRVFVHFKTGIIKGALLSFDTYKKDLASVNYFAISWPHYCEKIKIVDELYCFIKSIMNDNLKHIRIVLTSNDGSISDYLIEKIDREGLRNLIMSNSSYIFINFKSDVNIAFADLEPNIGDTEMQAGTILSKKLLSNNQVLNMTAKMIFDTGIVKSNNFIEFQNIIELIIKKLVKRFNYE
ncbi:MAG: hypothetical protein V2A67_03805 [Bacteroidota bacterium]